MTAGERYVAKAGNAGFVLRLSEWDGSAATLLGHLPD